MDLLYSFFFGAGVAGFTYSRMSRRTGYGNTQSITLIVGVVFVLTTVFFYTVLAYVLHI